MSHEDLAGMLAAILLLYDFPIGSSTRRTDHLSSQGGLRKLFRTAMQEYLAHAGSDMPAATGAGHTRAMTLDRRALRRLPTSRKSSSFR